MYVCIPIFTRKSIAAKYTSLQVRKTFAYYVKESNYECAHKPYEQYITLVLTYKNTKSSQSAAVA